MLNLYEDYESQEDRELAVLLEQADIEADKALLALDTCHRMNELSMREAECRLVMESGSVLDLADYYEEATSDGKGKEENIFQRIWGAIKNILRTIKEKIFGKAGDADPNKEYEVDQSFLDKHQKLKAAVDAVKRALANPVIKLILAAISAVAAVMAVKTVGKKVKLRGDKVNQIVSEEKRATNDLEKSIDRTTNKEGKGFAADLLEKFKELLTKIKDLASSLAASARHAVGLYTKEELDEANKQGKLKGMKLAKEQQDIKNNDKTGRTPDEVRKHAQNQARDEGIEHFRQTGAYAIDESAEDGDDDYDMYAEDAGDLSDIEDLLAEL